LQNAFLHFRDLNLTSGVAPALPLAFLVLVFYVGIWAFLLRLAYWRYRYADIRNLPLDNYINSDFTASAAAIDRGMQGGFKNGTWKAVFWATVILSLLLFRRWVLPIDMLETAEIRWLVSVFIVLVVLTLWLNWFRFISCWQSLQEILNGIEPLPIKTAFNRMPHETSLPIWQWRTSDSCLLLRQIVERFRTLLATDCNAVSPALKDEFNDWIKHQTSLDSVDEAEKEKAVMKIVQVLIPWLKDNYWGRVASGDQKTSEADAPQDKPDPKFAAAEDIVALLFYDYIRHVVIELRNLLFFLAAAFCLLFGALHVYAFRADSAIDWSMIGLFIIQGTGIVIVLAQMERNALLSRLADGSAGGLGKNFYFDLLKYGTVPLLTVLSSQVPFISNNVLRWLQPALEALH
jgi:hypothetical protein